MQTALRIAAIAVAALATALWFFGGMNPGGTTFQPDPSVAEADPAPREGGRPRDFRPGPGFLVTGLGVAAVLGTASLLGSGRRRGPGAPRGTGTGR